MLDWKERNKYKDATETLSPVQWRWEFLRRDPDYQRAWESRTGKIEIDEANASIFNLESFIDPKIPAWNLSAEEIKFIRRAGYQLTDYKCAIAHYFSKEDGEKLDREFFTTAVRRILYDKSKAVFVFDITKPIDDQIEHVKKSLVDMQDKYAQSISSQLKKFGKEMPRRGTDDEIPIIVKNSITPKFDHLRVLDAKAQNISDEEIGLEIYHVQDKNEAQKRGKRERLYANQMWRLI